MDQVSPKGAVGLMQLMPATAKRFGVDACDPADNVRGGVRFLRILQERYRNPMHVLAAYNAGEDAVEQHRGVPPYPETVRYVAAVLNDLNGWPKPVGATASRPRRGVATPDPSNPEASWSQGFVMHVEN
jgi:soluble lytic murein transglycosylase-like protein